MNPVTVPYNDGLRERLKDSVYAAAYLDAALAEDDQEVFLLALRDVAEARSFTAVAQDSELNRENLYRMLSRQGNPQLSSLTALLKSMGLRLAVEVQQV